MTGLLALLMLGWRAGFRMNNPYWSWRLETAFGADEAKRPPWRARCVAAVHYGRWVWAMRRFIRAD